nr:hypothetical protein [Pectobacterium atrosepticum]
MPGQLQDRSLAVDAQKNIFFGDAGREPLTFMTACDYLVDVSQCTQIVQILLICRCHVIA